MEVEKHKRINAIIEEDGLDRERLLTLKAKELVYIKDCKGDLTQLEGSTKINQINYHQHKWLLIQLINVSLKHCFKLILNLSVNLFYIIF